MAGPFETAALALLVTVLRAGGATSAVQDQAAQTPPNLLLVTMDTTRADHLGCYGAADARTPTVDRLAREGVLFEQALSPSPMTLPSHASLLTGRPPRLHGVRDNELFELLPGETTLAERLAREGYATVAVVGAAVLDRSTGIGQGFRVFDDEVRTGRKEWFNWEERAAEMVTRAALQHLAGVGEPFFLWVHYYDPHLPYVPPEPFASELAGRPYAGEIAYMDAELGRLLEGVASRAQGRGLLVAVAGDHGESLGEHGEASHGIFVYQATQHVPLLLHGPGLPRGRRITDHVGLVDLAPTLLDLLGLPVLDEATGESLRSLMAGPPHHGKRPAYELESAHGYFAYGWAPLSALVADGLKVIDAPDVELYDLAADPGESVNLAPARSGRARRLRDRLHRLRGVDRGLPSIPPTTSGDAAVQLDRLLSLGYVGGTISPGTGASAAGVGRPLPDPKTTISLVADLDRSRQLVASGQPGQAAAILEDVLRRNPDNLPALLVLGTAYRNAGDVDRAIRAHRRAVERSPASHLTHFNLAVSLLDAGGEEQRREATDALRRALARNPRHAETYQTLASLLVEEGDLEGARAVLQDAADQEVRDAELLFLRATVDAALGDLAAADRGFGEVMALDPGHARAHAGRARIAYLRGDPAGAATGYRRALELAPDAGLARTLGAILLNDLDDIPGAREAFALALRLAPDSPEAPALEEMIRMLDGKSPDEVEAVEP